MKHAAPINSFLSSRDNTRSAETTDINFRDAEPAVCPHPLTFEPFGIDLFDEVGVDVSCYELGLGDDVPQHWDVVVDTCGEREEVGGGGEKEGTCSVSNQWNIVLHTAADTSYL